MSTRRIHTVVIGGGQAGLCTSYYLQRHGIDHVVLERSSVASSWRRRWDSFTLVTPNRFNRLPEVACDGAPSDFLTRAQVIDYVERFAAIINPPLLLGVDVHRVTPARGGLLVTTSAGDFEASNVVVATGTFQRPRIPEAARRLPSRVLQLHSDAYRRPDALPEGAVLVVGSAQSGAQIADELRSAGRDVWLSVSRATRLPRWYRGRDIMEWAQLAGIFDRSVDELESPAERFEPNPHVSGRGGGRTLDLRQFGQDGVTLVGKVAGAEDGRLHFAADLEENLENADRFVTGLTQKLDQMIDAMGLGAPPPTDEECGPRAWRPTAEVRTLSLEESGVRSVIWATGYSFDYRWVGGASFDEFGYPVQDRGVTETPGLYFSGLHWLHKQSSALLYGVAEGAEYVADHIRRRGVGR